MGFLEACRFILGLLSGIKRFLILQKQNEIILIKNNALENGDQRELEDILSTDEGVINNVLPVGKYNGMYERPSKKKP